MRFDETNRVKRVQDDTYGQAALQTKLLEILDTFIKICDENSLTYFACGGTCIGALRHNGFIPWDDDLDVFMPRADYEKLWDIRGSINSEKYKLCRTDKFSNYHHRVQQLVDLETTFINKRSVDEDIEHGIYIDIIPMDACAPTRIGRLIQIFNSVLFSVYNIQCLPEFNGGRLLKFFVSLALFLVPSKKIRYIIWKSSERRMSKWKWDEVSEVVELAASFKVLKNPYPKEWFEGTVKHRFEDIEINLPLGVDLYLKQVFGDYMEYPPEEERRPRHNTVKIDLDKSYLEYKGKLYCKQ